MTGRWQLNELDQHLVPGEKYSKKISGTLGRSREAPHYAR